MKRRLFTDRPLIFRTTAVSLNTPRGATRRNRLALCLSFGMFTAQATALAATVNTFDPAGSQYTVPASINTAGVITGYYQDASYGVHGFVRDSGGALTTFDVPGASHTEPRDINTAGAIAGRYY